MASYSSVLIFLPLLLAILGSLAAFALAAQLDQETPSWQERFALANSGLGLGITIWSVHFATMINLQSPLLEQSNFALTAGAVAAAIVCASAGLYLAMSRRLGIISVPLGGLLIGLGIAGTHYLTALSSPRAGPAVDAKLLAAAGTNVVGCILAMGLAFRRRTFAATTASSVVQGLAIAAPYYSVLGGTLASLVAAAESTTPVPREWVMYLIACGVAVVSASNLVLLALILREGLSRRQVRLVQESFKKVEPLASRAADLFYEKLFQIKPQVRQLFPDDLASQKAKLMTTLHAAVVSLHKIEQIAPIVRELGKRHVNYGVTADDYKAVGAAVLWSLARMLGKDFTRETKSAWLAAYKVLSGTMIAAAAEVTVVEQGVPQQENPKSVAA